MFRTRKFFGGSKRDKAGEALSPPMPELYSTGGDYGIRVIAEPPDAALDIVFVHGLTGHRENTWTHANRIFWPKLLADDIQSTLPTRIMTWGYDANPARWGMVSDNNVRSHGKNLAYDMSDRRRGCRDRPIVFIAHSLGGLVCEQAILICKDGDLNLNKVCQSTRGILFMGTPHAGADLAKFAVLFAKYLNLIWKTNSKLLDFLKPDSDALEDVQQRFQPFALKSEVNINIYCFYEEREVRGVGYIVPQHSAALAHYPNQSIAANHIEMTKFSGKNDGGYQRVLGRVQDILELMGAAHTTLEDPRNHPDYDKRTRCHQLFRTSKYEEHKNRNPDPVIGTCVWFLEHPNYVNWRDSQCSGLLWVSADPGCGKSVLSKFLVDKELQATDSRTTCYCFFKDDNEDQKTITKALCTILHQIFEQKPELLKYAVEFRGKNGDKITENIDLLWSLLLAASVDPQAGEIICILDALDECRESELERFLPMLCHFYQDVRSPAKRNLKVLLTSRPYYRIEHYFTRLSHKIPTIRLAGEEETEKISHEIDLVIENNLTNLEAEMHLSPATTTSLRGEFTKVKHRTYLWLTLIMDMIRGDLQAVTKSGRQKIFGALPASVDDAYTAILNRSTDKAQAKKLLQIVCAAYEPLSITEVYIALSIQPGHKLYDDLDLQSVDYSKKMIRNLCGLFVSIIDRKVYLLHQTAKEFLMNETAPLQWNFDSPFGGNWKHSISVQSSNFVLAHSCMWYLLLGEPDTTESLYDDEIDQLVTKYDFLEYSANNWADHFRAASVPEEHSSIDFILDLFQNPHGQYRGWLSFYGRGRFISQGSLHLAAYCGLQGVISRLLATAGVSVNRKIDGDTPLCFAAGHGHRDIVHQLIAAPGIDVNLADNRGRTPLELAASIGHHATVSQLLTVPSIDVNRADSSGWTPLHQAAASGHHAIVSQLLTVPSIDVNLADNRGRTPLVLAASIEHHATVSQLLTVPSIDVNKADNRGFTPLSLAVMEENEKIVRQLLAFPGIDVNRQNEKGLTPLSIATKRAYETIVEFLLSFPGIDVNTVDYRGDEWDWDE